MSLDVSSHRNYHVSYGGGTCPWCLGNRMYKHLKKMINYERTGTDTTEQDTV